MQTIVARRRRELWSAACYCAILIWINVYIARDFFAAHTAHMNSMHGFWIAMAKRAGSGWFHPTWWPYWDCGIPFEAAYQPLVPALTAAWVALGSIPHDQAFGCVSGFFYCLAPISLFAMGWTLTRQAGTSFMAALFYSLTSITQLILPDGRFRLDEVWHARRLYITAVWDDTPHLAALSLLPLAILCIVLALQRRSRIWSLSAAAVVALMTATSAFGAVDTVMAAICLVFVLPRESWRTNALRIAGIGAFGYLMAGGMVPPSVWVAIQDSAHYSPEEKWSLGSVTAVAVVFVGWTVLHHLLKRSTKDWRVHFLVLFAWLMSSIPFTWDILGRRFMPQPGRYKLELELALALPIALGIRWLMQKLPAPVRRATILLMLALAAEQIVTFRKLEKAYLAPQDVTTTVEYRTASWVEHNLPGQRVLFPGSVAQWANAFAGTLQFSGGPWSQATNRSQQFAQADILFAAGPKISEISLIWLKAYGVSAVGVSAPDSKEFWKPYADPSKFDALPVLWSDQGVTIRKVPLRTASLSHVVADDAIVPRRPRNPEDVGGVRKYVAALDDPSFPVATLDWQDNNHIRIGTTASPGQVISVQVGYHPGWHATVNGERREIRKDGLGLMWLRPDCHGACEINLAYGGGLELWVSRVVSYGAIAALVVMFGVAILRRLRRGSAVYSASQATLP